MLALQGTAASAGTAAGVFLYFRRGGPARQGRQVGTPESELLRFQSALSQADLQLQELCRETLAQAGEECAQVFEIHRMMLQDEDFLDAVKDAIRQKGAGAEQAVEEVSRTFSEAFLAMQSPYMQARSADVQDISLRLLRLLRGEEEPQLSLPFPVILGAQDLCPSETIRLDKTKLLAIVTAEGSQNSHTAILARTMGIPCVVCLGGVLSEELDGRQAAVDGGEGMFWLEPTEEVRAHIQEKGMDLEARRRELERWRGKPAQTKNGKKISLLANAGSIEDCRAAVENDAEGIGLFRTEFQYLGSAHRPSEEELFSVYRAAVEAMQGRPVTFRTIDLGADKQAPWLPMEQEENPALGLRAVRLCLADRELLRTQLRALYRASALGPVSIMAPMIASLWELQEVKREAQAAREGLRAQGVPVAEHVPLGIMVETPAAALLSAELAGEADFFSIGTNDLTQYTLAADRQNGRLGPFYDARHPAVLALLRMTLENARAAGIPVGICGDLAGDLAMTGALLSMGISSLSVPPGMVLPLRERVCTLTV